MYMGIFLQVNHKRFLVFYELKRAVSHKGMFFHLFPLKPFLTLAIDNVLIADYLFL